MEEADVRNVDVASEEKSAQIWESLLVTGVMTPGLDETIVQDSRVLR